MRNNLSFYLQTLNILNGNGIMAYIKPKIFIKQFCWTSRLNKEMHNSLQVAYRIQTKSWNKTNNY